MKLVCPHCAKVLRTETRPPEGRQVKCPACEDISVAQSTATSAVAVRHEIAQRVRAGASDSQILTSLEATYGTSILLSPSTTGLGSLLWLVPVAALVAMLIAGVRLWRRR